MVEINKCKLICDRLMKEKGSQLYDESLIRYFPEDKVLIDSLIKNDIENIKTINTIKNKRLPDCICKDVL